MSRVTLKRCPVALLLLVAVAIEYQRSQSPEPKMGFDAVPLANAPGDQWPPPEVWRIRVSNGTTEQITSGGGFAPAISPDGAYVFYTQTQAIVTSLWQLTLANKQKKLISNSAIRRAYAPAKNGIYYIRLSTGAKRELCFIDFRSSKEIMLTRLDGVDESGMSVSPEAKWLYFSKVEHRSRDLMIVDNFWGHKAVR